MGKILTYTTVPRISCIVPPQQNPNGVNEYLREGTKINPFKKFGY